MISANYKWENLYFHVKVYLFRNISNICLSLVTNYIIITRETAKVYESRFVGQIKTIFYSVSRF